MSSLHRSPTAFSERLEPLVVELETTVGSGDFRPDPRWRVREVKLRSDTEFSTADLSVRLDDDFDASLARETYHPDRRVRIRTDHVEPAKQAYLLEGYPRFVQSEWSGKPGGAQDGCHVRLIHVAERLARDPVCQIFGRHMRSAAIEDGLAADTAAWQDQSRLVETLPCVFNAAGNANCSPVPLQATDRLGQTRTIHIFTYDGDPAALPWTFLRALRYLCWFYFPAGGPLDSGRTFDDTEPYVHASSDDRVAAGGGHLIPQLLHQPDALTCENVSLWQALATLVGAADVHHSVETTGSDGAVRTSLRLWAAQDGPLRDLRLARGGRFADRSPRFDSRGRTAAEVIEASNIYRALLQWDAGQILSAPIVLGGAKSYEFTLSLVPGWVPEPGLDNVAPADAPAAKAVVIPEALIPALGQDPNNFDWYRKYHKFGDDFAQYSNVGRKWVLNEAGTYDSETYSRNPPFDSYVPFEWSTVAEPDVAAPGQWARRKRRFLDSVSREFLHKGTGIYAEVSFDSGAAWHPLLFHGISALSYEVGVYFGTPNLTSMTPPLTDPLEQNMWWAIIDQTFRVRVTGVIESDRRLRVAWPAGEYAGPTLQVHSRIVDRGSEFRHLTRRGVTNLLVQPGEEPAGLEVDDSPGLEKFTAEFARADHDRRVTVLPAIPWLEIGYRPGDRIGRVTGRQVDLGRRAGYTRRYPAVVGVTWRLEHGHETELTIE